MAISENTASSEYNQTRNNLLSERAGFIVVIGCLLLAMFLVGLLFYQTHQLNTDPDMVSICNQHSDVDKANCPEEAQSRVWVNRSLNPLDAAKVALEYDAQFLRTKRAQSIVSAQLFVQSIAILAGVSLLTMGSAFVFARIRTPQSTAINYEGSDGGKFEFASYSPGLVLALFGTLIICAALIASVNSKRITKDVPVFMDRVITFGTANSSASSSEELNIARAQLGEIFPNNE